jgi:hypothetical protein
MGADLTRRQSSLLRAASGAPQRLDLGRPDCELSIRRTDLAGQLLQVGMVRTATRVDCVNSTQRRGFNGAALAWR